MDIFRPILIVAGAIVAAVILFKIVAVVTAIVFQIVVLAILAGVLYGGFLLVRSSLRKPTKPTPR